MIIPNHSPPSISHKPRLLQMPAFPLPSMPLPSPRRAHPHNHRRCPLLAAPVITATNSDEESMRCYSMLTSSPHLITAASTSPSPCSCCSAMDRSHKPRPSTLSAVALCAPAPLPSLTGVTPCVVAAVSLSCSLCRWEKNENVGCTGMREETRPR